MAIILRNGADVLHPIDDSGEGDGVVPGAVYRLAVPDRGLRLEYDRDVRDACDALAQRLGLPALPYHGRAALEALFDAAIARLAEGDDLAEIQARVEAWREARGGRADTVPADVAGAQAEIERQVYALDADYRDALRDNERRAAIGEDCMLRRFVLAIDGAAPFERPRGRLSDADLERIPPAHRLALVVRLIGLMAPTEAEEKKSA